MEDEVDVLIAVAVPDEWKALKKLLTNQASKWHLLDIQNNSKFAGGLPFIQGKFQTAKSVIKVAAILAKEQGSNASSRTVSPLVGQLKPKLLAMCGVCGGNPKKVNLGDVLIAKATYSIDFNTKTEPTTSGSTTFSMSTLHEMSNKLFTAVTDFEPSGSWCGLPNIEDQILWCLDVLLSGGNPSQKTERNERCPHWTVVCKELFKRKFVDQSMFLTPEGRAHINAKRLEKGIWNDGERYPLTHRFTVHCDAIAMGVGINKMQDRWDRLETYRRDVIGVEMEGDALAAVAAHHQVEHFLLMKAAMDFSTFQKTDDFKDLGCDASADCLLDFIFHTWDSLCPDSQPNATRVELLEGPRQKRRRSSGTSNEVFIRSVVRSKVGGDVNIS